MKNMIAILSTPAKRTLASVLAVVMVFSLMFFAAPDSVILTAHAMSYSGDSGRTTFTSGDQICVVNTMRDTKNKTTYTFDAAGATWTADDSIVWNSGTDANNKFEAYYPVADYASFDSFTIPTDQSDAAKLAAADWMTVRTEAMAKTTEGKLDLELQHRLVKVTVKITTWEDQYNKRKYAVSEAKIYSKGTSITAAYDDSGNANVTTSGTVTDTAITAFANSDDDTYTAIVAPGEYNATDTFMTFKIAGSINATVLAKNDILTGGLEAGNHYTFNLTVGKERVEISGVTVEGWIDGGIIDGGVAEEVPNVMDTTVEFATGSSDFAHTGSAITPEVTVTAANGTALVKDTDYTVEYSNNTDPGTATITITGIGEWTGTVTKEFTIVQSE